MKIMILGKNGQLGQELCNFAKKQNCEVFAFGHEDLDVTNENEFTKKVDEVNPDIVINTTAFHVVPDCDTYPDKAFNVNCFAVTKMAAITFSKNIKFLTYSTDYVFDGTKNEPYLEDDIPNPQQMYGLSKYAGEIGVLNYSKLGYVVRTCGVYGGKTGSKSKKGNFALNILDKAKTEKEIEVSSEQIVNPTYAVDLAEKTIELILKNAEPGIYHLANTGYCSWADFAEKVIEFANLSQNVKIKKVNRGGAFGGIKRPLFSVLSSSKLAKYQIEMPSWSDALKRYINSLSI